MSSRTMDTFSFSASLRGLEGEHYGIIFHLGNYALRGKKLLAFWRKGIFFVCVYNHPSYYISGDEIH